MVTEVISLLDEVFMSHSRLITWSAAAGVYFLVGVLGIKLGISYGLLWAANYVIADDQGFSIIKGVVGMLFFVLRPFIQADSWLLLLILLPLAVVFAFLLLLRVVRFFSLPPDEPTSQSKDDDDSQP